MKLAKGDVISYHSKVANGYVEPLGSIELDVYHLGIYTGTSVIHFNEEIERVEEIPLEEFYSDEGLFCVPNYSKIYSDDDIVKRARERLGPRSFDIIRNNCEHFVYEVTEDNPRSPQAEYFKKRVKEKLKSIDFCHSFK